MTIFERSGTGWRGRGTALRPRAIQRGLLVLVCLTAAAPASAQQALGRIVGRVVNSQTGDPISGAHVSIAGSGLGTLTDLNGRYILQNVGTGVHALAVQVIGFERKTVTGLQVGPGTSVYQDISVAPQAIDLEGVVVRAAIERGNTTALLAERRRSGVVTDAVGAEQISRSPDGDAASVLARAPGVSVVDDRYVYVRGLGDRYGAATLNGTPLASPEPDKKVVPLDIIPSAFLESVVTVKTFSPDQAGDYAGGLIQIRTKDFPREGIVKLGVSGGYNPEVTFADGLGYQGGSYDFLAMDDGTRGLPEGLPAQRITGAGFTPDELEAIGEGFLGTWGPTRSRLPAAQSFDVAVGNELSWFDDQVPVGYLVAVTQSTGSSHKGGLVERVVSGGEAFEVDYLGDASARTASLGGMLNFSIQPTPGDRLTLAGLYNRSTDDESRILQGYNGDFSTNQRNHRIRYLANEMLSAQLKGEHELGFLGHTRVSWRTDVSRAGRYEPNTREVLYRQSPDGRYLFETFVQSGSIFHSDLAETGYGAGIDVEIPLAVRSLPAAISVGGAYDLKDRDAFARRFRFLPQAPLDAATRELGPNELFNPQTIDPAGFQITEATFPGDNYTAAQTVAAGYAMVDAEIVPRLRFLGGARIERAIQEVQPLRRFLSTNAELAPAALDHTDLLPGLNLTYEVSDAMTLRLGASRTLARPQFRELAPFQFTDYAGGFLTIGNPALERAGITNYDVRWEWFPDLGSLVAVSGFYKKFEAPIETVVLASTELIQTWFNAGGATNYGAEVEVRSSLGFIGEPLRALAVNANLTLVESEVATGESIRVYLPFGVGVTELSTVERGRALQGQSPYVVNLGLDYGSAARGTRATLLYNRFGRRIDTVGGNGLPDILEEPRGRLDLVLEQPFGSAFAAKVSAQRLLGSEVEFTQDGRTVRQFDPGRAVSFSLSWNLGG